MRRELQVDRRRFISWLSIGATAGLAGCAGSSGDDSGSGDGGTGDGGAGNGGDGGGGDGGSMGGDRADKHVILTLLQSSQSLHPFFETSQPDNYANQMTYSYLTRLDHNLDTHPDLATDWQINDPGDQWTVQLRDDATFHHDGSAVLAEDVKATIDKIFNPDEDWPAASILGPVESVDVINDHAVQIGLSRPDASLPKKFSSPLACIVPKDVIENDFDALHNEDFGSGPFVLDRFEKGDETSVTAYEDYFGTDDQGNPLPYVGRFTIRTIPEISTEVSALRNRDVDIIERVPPSHWDPLANDPNVKALSTPGGRFHPLIMKTTVEPFDDIRVRHAFKYAVDKREILEVVQNGMGVLAQDTPIGPAHTFYAEIDDPFGPGSKLEEAQALLDEAGYSDGLRLEEPVYAPAKGTPETGQTAVIIKEHLAKVGVQFDIQEVTWDVYLAEHEPNATLQVDSFTMRPVTDQMLQLVGHSDGSFNWGIMPPEPQAEFDRTLEAATSEPDEARRGQLLAECQQILHTNGGFITPFFAETLTACGSYMQNYHADPTEQNMVPHIIDVDLANAPPR